MHEDKQRVRDVQQRVHDAQRVPKPKIKEPQPSKHHHDEISVVEQKRMFRIRKAGSWHHKQASLDPGWSAKRRRVVFMKLPAGEIIRY